MSEEKVKYEYKILSFRDFNKIGTTNTNTIEEELNKLSVDGWELVSVVEERHYFKREIGKKQLLD